MKTTQGPHGLEICLEGRIDSVNAVAVEAEMEKAIAVSAGKDLVLNAEKLEYISSAGLRLLMKLRKEGWILKIINVSPAVYEIFEETGFTGIFTVRKALRKLHIEENGLLGQGTFGTVYRVDDETVVKVFNKRATMDTILREREFAQKAYLAGIPAVITYDVVEVNGRIGIVYEMAKGASMSEQLRTAPDSMNELADRYTSLLKRIHSTEMAKGSFPGAKDIFHGHVDAAGYLDNDRKAFLHRLIDAVPDASTMLHGDYHPHNVKFQDGEMVVIDLTDVSLGSPLFDLAGMYASHIVVGSYDPKFIAAAMGVPFETCLALWKAFFRRYFALLTPADQERMQDVVRRFTMLKIALMYVIAPGIEDLLGWKPLEDAEKILFTDGMKGLLEDVARFSV